MKVAAYQAPLLASGSMDAVELIRSRVRSCETAGVSLLCCPEGILGGLADYAKPPYRFAIPADARLEGALAPLTSDTVTTIVGFTELAGDGRVFNSAAVFHRGRVAGVYRKQHPAIRRSVYSAGDRSPVFNVAGLTFGIVICNDSNFPEPAKAMAAAGATAIFVPTNNGLPASRDRAGLTALVTKVDVARATENRVWIIRADVFGTNGSLVSDGSSEIVTPQGAVVTAAGGFVEGLLIAEIEDTDTRARGTLER